MKYIDKKTEKSFLFKTELGGLIVLKDLEKERTFIDVAYNYEPEEPFCEDCNGEGTVMEGEFDDIKEVPCICVKEALQDKEMQEI